VTDATPVTGDSHAARFALSRWLTEEVVVTAIPPSAFYSAENVPLAKNMLRFAFCKSNNTIIEAHVRFEAYFDGSSPGKHQVQSNDISKKG
jgi:aspartate/methionine/tyrosine aminotransferase